jgi:hypothetical protein
VRWYRGPEGDQRIWYEPQEIEQIAEDELKRAGLAPEPYSPVTDLERFIESHLGADLDQYANLGADVLGLTRFDPGRRPAVSINRELTESAEDESRRGLAGRWRATLAHEASHVVFHRYLFDADLSQPTLFDAPLASDAASRGLMRCLKRDVGLDSRSTDWREIQANRGMAALLMPRAVFRCIADQRIAALSLTDLTSGSVRVSQLAAEMAKAFAVSRQAATIRLETLSIVTAASSTQLPGI